ncbi:DUF695 domain-containing protein [Paraflavitalea pollutisoli]|uniref:DUF695 domain-containing protein n=1 Tax=Paraflavitalea pollutisoli TaxID=3034143 RepID=UPI0023EB2FB2|nr:DUF695 domain-containing protein [Paraflavitalea sp. H1-2-19X]
MGLLSRLFSKIEAPVVTYDDFWKWFQSNAAAFHKVVKQRGDLEKEFFDKLGPKLNALKDGYWYLTGMYDDHCAELVLTADGALENIVFVEELVAAAPAIPHWRITALKPALSIEDVNINMDGYEFKESNLSFYATHHEDYPDEVDIVFVYDGFNETDRDTIVNGVFIFLDNYLGELYAATAIDKVTVRGREQQEQELIPMGKLKDYLIWREKEFVEKYSDVWHDNGDGQYALMEGTLKSGNPIIGVIDQDLLEWDGKASHPWMVVLELKYGGKASQGMPDRNTSDLLNAIEDELTPVLPAAAGYLHIGRTTANNVRTIYWACKEFRQVSKVLFATVKKYEGRIDISYDIFKDKYWQSVEQYRQR